MPGEHVVAEQDVLASIGLHRTLVSQRSRILVASLENPDCLETDACQRMLEKVRSKEPVRPREVFRSYKRQRKDILQPILDTLLQSGRLRIDEKGFLRMGPDTLRTPLTLSLKLA